MTASVDKHLNDIVKISNGCSIFGRKESIKKTRIKFMENRGNIRSPYHFPAKRNVAASLCQINQTSAGRKKGIEVARLPRTNWRIRRYIKQLTVCVLCPGAFSFFRIFEGWQTFYLVTVCVHWGEVFPSAVGKSVQTVVCSSISAKKEYVETILRQRRIYFFLFSYGTVSGKHLHSEENFDKHNTVTN